MKLRRLLVAVGLMLWNVQHAESCVGKRHKPIPHNDIPPNNNQNPAAVKNLLGDNVQTNPYDSGAYDDKNGVASSSDDLKCDFESKCCWKNSKPPYDTMEWVQASGTPDPDKLKNNFGTDTPPTGNFLLVSSDNAASDTDKAEFESCSIPCASDTIKVTLKHWATQGVKLQVCEVAKSDPTILVACQDVPSAAPGPDTVTLPAGSDLLITISASGFTASGGSVAMIDDILVDYPPCSSTYSGSSQPPGTAPPAQLPAGGEAGKLCCGFDKDTCNWNKGSGPSSARGTVNEFTKAGPERFMNPATGVPPSRDRFFYATYLKQKESAYTECLSNFDQDRIIKFEEYKAVQGVNLKACCDTDTACTYETGNKVQKQDYGQWYAGSVKCPAGTKKVIFFSENNGDNEGGVGLDNIEVYDVNGKKIC